MAMRVIIIGQTVYHKRLHDTLGPGRILDIEWEGPVGKPRRIVRVLWQLTGEGEVSAAMLVKTPPGTKRAINFGGRGK